MRHGPSADQQVPLPSGRGGFQRPPSATRDKIGRPGTAGRSMCADQVKQDEAGSSNPEPASLIVRGLERVARRPRPLPNPSCPLRPRCRPGSEEGGVDSTLSLGIRWTRVKKGAVMSTSDGSTPNAVKREDSTGLSAKKGVMERGLGRDFNITVIAALLSLVVALTTTMITSRIAAGNALKEARRDQEREAIVRLEQALLRETHATFAVVAEGVPAKFPPVGDEFAFDGLKAVSDRVIDYLSARRECDAARTAVEDAQIRAVTKEVFRTLTQV